MKAILNIIVVPSSKEFETMELGLGKDVDSSWLNFDFKDGSDIVSRFIEIDGGEVDLWKEINRIVYELIVSCSPKELNLASAKTDKLMQELKEVLDNWEPGKEPDE